MIKIMDEHAWVDERMIHARLKLNDNENMINISGMISFTEDGSEKVHFAVTGDGSGIFREYDVPDHSGENHQDEISEVYDDYEESMQSLYADYIAIAKRMLDECSCRVQRVQYEIISRESRMIDNFFEKIPEAEMEIAFRDGSHVYLFAYQTPVYEEYAISRVSWFALDKASDMDREHDIIESYDTFQECLTSHYPELFFELKELIENEMNLAMEQMSDDEEDM